MIDRLIWALQHIETVYYSRRKEIHPWNANALDLPLITMNKVKLKSV